VFSQDGPPIEMSILALLSVNGGWLDSFSFREQSSEQGASLSSHIVSPSNIRAPFMQKAAD
jgi:hypothetical protein